MRFSLLLLVSCLFSLSACAQPGRPTHQKTSHARRAMLQPYQTERFRLSASPGSAVGYPSQILEGRFITSTGGSFPVPWGYVLTTGWGGGGTAWVVGDALQPVPDTLELRWYSCLEDKFYEGRFLMPQERLYNLLKQGRWSKWAKKQITYNGFAVCVVPTGVVYVWLEMDGSNRVFVGRYEGRELLYDFARYKPRVDRAATLRINQNQASPEARAEWAAGKLSARKWDSWVKRYPWQLAFSQPLTLTDYGISYFSAEATGNPDTPDMVAFAQQLLTPQPKPVPSDWMVYVAGAYGRKKLFKVDPFDEHETMGAFQTLAAAHPGEPLTLFVETNEQLTKANLSLRAGKQIIPLTKTQVQLFDLP